MRSEVFKEENVNMKVQGRKRENDKLRKPNKSGVVKAKRTRRGRKGRKLSSYIIRGISCWNSKFVLQYKEGLLNGFTKESDMKKLAS